MFGVSDAGLLLGSKQSVIKSIQRGTTSIYAYGNTGATKTITLSTPIDPNKAIVLISSTTFTPGTYNYSDYQGIGIKARLVDSTTLEIFAYGSYNSYSRGATHQLEWTVIEFA